MSHIEVSENRSIRWCQKKETLQAREPKKYQTAFSKTTGKPSLKYLKLKKRKNWLQKGVERSWKKLKRKIKEMIFGKFYLRERVYSRDCKGQKNMQFFCRQFCFQHQETRFLRVSLELVSCALLCLYF